MTVQDVYLLLLLQAEDVPSVGQEDQAGEGGNNSSGQNDAELPAGVQEGEPRPLKRSRRYSVPLIDVFSNYTIVLLQPSMSPYHDYLLTSVPKNAEQLLLRSKNTIVQRNVCCREREGQ